MKTDPTMVETVLPSSGVFFRLRQATLYDMLVFNPGPLHLLHARMAAQLGLFDDEKWTVEQVQALDAADGVLVLNMTTNELNRISASLKAIGWKP